MGHGEVINCGTDFGNLSLNHYAYSNGYQPYYGDFCCNGLWYFLMLQSAHCACFQCSSYFIALTPCSSMYGYERVMAELEVFKPILVDITQGKVKSEFHRIFNEGTRKEQYQLKVAPKAGPLKWSTSKVSLQSSNIYSCSFYQTEFCADDKPIY